MKNGVRNWIIATFSATLFSGVALASGSSLNGTWQSDCQNFGTLNSSARHTIKFSKNVIETSSTDYMQPNCTGEVGARSQLKGDYELNGAGSELSVKIESAKIAMTNADEIANRNEIKLCGFSDWALNEMKEVIGTECGKSINQSQASKLEWISRNEINMTTCGSAPASCTTVILHRLEELPRALEAGNIE